VVASFTTSLPVGNHAATVDGRAFDIEFFPLGLGNGQGFHFDARVVVSHHANEVDDADRREPDVPSIDVARGSVRGIKQCEGGPAVADLDAGSQGGGFLGQNAGTKAAACNAAGLDTDDDRLLDAVGAIVLDALARIGDEPRARFAFFRKLPAVAQEAAKERSQ